MAGYSGTPLPQKLGIKEGSTLAFVNAPENFRSTLGELPAGVEIVSVDEGNLDVIIYFSVYDSDLEQRFAALKPLLSYSGGLWIAWPKKLPGEPRNYIEDHIRETGLAAGLLDNKVCAIDEAWSGLRFVYRVADRPKGR
jgi:hypothetical protein